MNRYLTRAVLTAAVVSAACDNARTVAGPSSGLGGPTLAIADAAHAGNAHFYFLPPMVANPTPAGQFDPTVTPVVDICAWSGSSCTGAPIATYTMTTGPGSETVRVSVTNEQFIVNWHTELFDLALGATYRIRALVRGSVVGFADIAIVANGSQVKNVATGENIPLVDGRTLPIKFRIEYGMPVAIALAPDPLTVITGKTGTLTAVVTDAHDNQLVGQVLTWAAANPFLATVNASGQVTGIAAGTTSVVASTSGISSSAAVFVIPPPVASIAVTPSTNTVNVGASVQLTATLKDADGNVLTGRPLAWTSSNPSLATSDVNGLVWGVQPGDVTITATSEGVSGTAQVSVAANRCVAPDGAALAFWPFEEGVGTSTGDLSGNGHTGNLQGTPGWIGGANGVGNALDFVNATDLVNVGSFLSTGVTRLTIGAWVYPTSFSNTGDIAVGGISGPRIISATDGDGWALGHAPGSNQIQVELRGITSFILPTAFPLNTWSNVVVVYDGASVATYLNGGLVDSRGASAGTIRQASSCTFIGNEPEGCGRQTNGNFAWQGRIDEVLVYDRAVNSAEVQALYRRCVLDPSN